MEKTLRKNKNGQAIPQREEETPGHHKEEGNTGKGLSLAI